MRKILISILTISAVSVLVIGGTISFFSDVEVSTSNTFTTGTIEIAVDDELHWSENFNWEDVKPGKEFEISFNITNEGENPLKLWQITKCLVTDENEIIEPEQAWYDEHPSESPKNDIDSAIVYAMQVDGDLVVAREAGITMDRIKNSYIGLMKVDQPFEPGNGDGILYPGDSVLVEQKYFMKEDTENWAQSDVMTFAIEIEARQINAPEPLQQMMFMENKLTGGDWSSVADERMGILKYDYTAPTFNYDFYATGLNPSMEYCLIYYADSGAGNNPGYFFASDVPTTDGVLELNGQANIDMDLPHPDDENYPDAAKIWLVNCNSYNKTTYGLTVWDMNNWVFENWPGLINYKEGIRPDEEIQCEDNGNTEPNSTCTDYDGDGYFAQASGCENEPGFLGHSDCNDGIPGDPIHPGNPDSWRVDFFYWDGDDDGYYGDGANRRGDGMMAICYGADIPTHYYESSFGEDCDDHNSSINPNVIEVCNNNLDDDCDGLADCMDSDCSSDSACSGVDIDTITLSDIGADPQYGYTHDYDNANVSFTYPTVNNNRLRGTIMASGLKPYMTYQLKLEGKPTCLPEYTSTGDDAINGLIGYKGRWWNNDTNANTTDAYYASNSGDCITGYLVWDYITADENGNAIKYIKTDNSYHVLWCSDGVCDHANNNSLRAGIDPAYPDLKLCSPFHVSGEIEKSSCGGLALDNDDYDLRFILNEESFHQGEGLERWVAVMDADIQFEIQ